METKTYYASSVQAAMDIARRELGPDAMLVNSRPAMEAARAFGKLEVTFAWEAHAAEPGRSVPDGSAGVRPGAAATQEGGLEDIRLEISSLRNAFGRVGRPALRTVADQAPKVDSEAVRSLCGSGFDKDTAMGIASRAATGPDRKGDSILATLTASLRTAPFAPLRPDESRTLAFAGPPGRGKTTSLVKIAVRYGLANRVPTRIFTAGSHGVGGAEQMARYAAILGVPFQAAESWEGLNLALQGDRWKGLVLIDTPGLALSDAQEMDAMAKFFLRRTDIERHLVIRADARTADMQYMASRFAVIQPSRLLFTGVDEVRGLGAAADTMIRTGIAATFFGTGPQIPDDLEEADAEKLARSLWASGRIAAAAA